MVSHNQIRLMIKLPRLLLEIRDGVLGAYRTVECLEVFRLLIEADHSLFDAGLDFTGFEVKNFFILYFVDHLLPIFLANIYWDFTVEFTDELLVRENLPHNVTRIERVGISRIDVQILTRVTLVHLRYQLVEV